MKHDLPLQEHKLCGSKLTKICAVPSVSVPSPPCARVDVDVDLHIHIFGVGKLN